MLDIFNLSNLEKNTNVFYSCGATCWQMWQKPRNCKIVNFFLAGGGGGGGGGATGTGTNRFGGGGGGSSPVQRGVFQAAMIPDTLYILVGLGGLGGAPNGAGGVGGITYISVAPVTTSASVLLRSANAGPTAGTAAGASGGGGSVFNQSTGLISYLGVTTQVTGVNGSAGGSNAGGVGAGQTKAGIFTGGAGGGGASSAGVQGSGGTVVSTVTSIIPSSNGGLAGATNDGGAGYFGLIPSIDASTKTPFTFVGGGGGGANATGIGGNGGNGAIGCGGGGGGAGTTGGRGGNGGDGIVIITCF